MTETPVFLFLMCITLFVLPKVFFYMLVQLYPMMTLSYHDLFFKLQYVLKKRKKLMCVDIAAVLRLLSFVSCYIHKSLQTSQGMNAHTITLDYFHQIE